MIKLVRTDSSNIDFIELVKQLDAYLKITDGDEHDFYNQFNSIDSLKHVIIAYENNKPIGCGAFKPFGSSKVEIKRMFTLTEERGKGIATKILNELEHWALELGYSYTILETGIRQTEAVEFYKKNNYLIIPNYGQYIGVENSLCFEKLLRYEKG
ncbi:GNAT family N-acetyltransferase [Winogradskyella sp. MIT101101]|uniref:GNAT family N-acetyltransferase n=1 Tax=Winogradskyella sp. MIT101101 TaxID=3098297 RepID=UPI00399962C6